MADESKVLEILKDHLGATGYRWFLCVGMDLIEALHAAIDDKRPGDIEDLSDAIVTILMDCHVALGVALVHVLMRDHCISFDQLVGADDDRREKLGKKYRNVIRAVIAGSEE